jgi:hypothetical protein
MRTHGRFNANHPRNFAFRDFSLRVPRQQEFKQNPERAALQNMKLIVENA